MIKKCIGCGVELQNYHKDRIGYTPLNLFEAKYCERCFKIIHYNSAKVVTLDSDQKDLIDLINKKAKHVLFLLDVLNINEETINTFKSISANKTLVVNKIDLLPKSIKLNRVKDFLYNVYNIDSDILFCSSLKKTNLSNIINYLEKNRIKSSYILGYTNAGKSTLINSLFNKYQDNQSFITTSIVPNTTLDFMNIKINDNITLIDSPGFILNESLVNLEDILFYKKINTKKSIKPITIQTKKDMVINIDNKVIIKVLDEIKNSLTFYISNDFNINKTFKYKVLNEFTKKDYSFNDNVDLVIKSLGFINIKKECNLEISMMNHNLIEVRKSLFKGDYNE